MNHVLPLPYATRIGCKFFLSCFFLIFALFGRDFLPILLVINIIFLGGVPVTILINLLVGLSLWCPFEFEDVCQFKIFVLYFLQFCR